MLAAGGSELNRPHYSWRGNVRDAYFILKLSLACVLSALLLAGCGYASYATPGKPANFRDLGLSQETSGMTEFQRSEMTDAQIQMRLNLKPLAAFPAHIVMCQIQDPEYRWGGRTASSAGNVAVVQAQDQAMTDEIRTLTDPPLPGVSALGTLSTMLVPSEIHSDADLRNAAAALKADMLLLYTFDTRVSSDEAVPYAGLLTLGLFPDRVAKATSNASAILIDTRNGYVYGTATGFAQTNQLTNFVGSDDAFDQALKRCEAQAITDLVKNLRTMWMDVLQEQAPQLTAAQQTH